MLYGTRPSVVPPSYCLRTWLEYMPRKSRQNQEVRLRTSSLAIGLLKKRALRRLPPSSIVRFSFVLIHAELLLFRRYSGERKDEDDK